MDAFSYLDHYAQICAMTTRAPREQAAQNQKLAQIWFSWPAIANCCLSKDSNEVVATLANWSGYGTNRRRTLGDAKSNEGHPLSSWAALVGQSLVGKSTVGNYLRKRFNMRVYDIDDMVADRAGTSVSDIFVTWGESVFREMELRVLSELLEREPGLLVLGGGSIQSLGCRCILRRVGKRIVLRNSLQTLWLRLKRRGNESKNEFKRDFATTSLAGKGFFELMWGIRQRLLLQIATNSVDCAGRNVSTVGKMVHSILSCDRWIEPSL